MNHRKSNAKVRSERRRALCALSVLVSVVLVCSTGRTDIVTEWNVKAVDTMTTQRVTGGALPARTLAMMHSAMFNSVNSVANRYKLYLVDARPDATDVSPEAAVHAAARRVLVDLYPKEKATLDAAFDVESQPVKPQRLRCWRRVRRTDLTVPIPTGRRLRLAYMSPRRRW